MDEESDARDSETAPEPTEKDRADLTKSLRRGLKQLSEPVGEVTICSAHLEDALANLLATLVQNPMVESITIGLSFDQLAKSCEVVLRDNPEVPGVERMTAALTLAREAYRDRNSLVHAVWANVHRDSPNITAIRVRRWRPGFTPRQWTLSEIRQVAANIRSATREVWACIHGLTSGDFEAEAVEDISYLALHKADGHMIVLNNMGVTSRAAARDGGTSAHSN